MSSKNSSLSLWVFVCLLIACLASGNLQAQKRYSSPITVQYTDGKTSSFATLDEAFAALKAGCVVYIPSGSYRISDKEESKIKCPVSIYGAGSRRYGKDFEYTRIEGTIQFAEGSSSSLLIGIYSHSNINVSANVKNLFIKNVDVANINFNNNSNEGCTITSSVVRELIDGFSGYGNYYAPLEITNCLVGRITQIKNGKIANCILFGYRNFSTYDLQNSLVANNISLGECVGLYSCQEECNMFRRTTDEIAFPQEGATALFVKYDPNDPYNLSKNDYHLKKGVAGTNAGTDGKDIGIYGGIGFDESGHAPIPKISIKEIAPQTDKDGKIKVKIEILNQ